MKMNWHTSLANDSLALKRRRLLAFGVSLPIVLSAQSLVTPAVFAQEDPVATMQSLAQYTIQTVGNGQNPPATRRAYAAQIVDQRFNTPKLGKLALGTIWRRMNNSERTAFLSKFRELMIEDFVFWFSDFDGSSWQVKSANRDRKDPNTVHVAVIYRRPNGTNVDSNWRAELENGVYRVLDIKIAGLSLLSDLRGKYRSKYSEGGTKTIMRFMDQHIRKRRQQLGG